MTDPISLIATGAAIGGVAGKFAEKAWDAGEKWVSSYFKDHGRKAQENAKKNSLVFLTNLAKKVETLEKQNNENKELIASALSRPDFSMLLQKAILASAQTDNEQKHELLARLISDRLTKKSESIHALTSTLACDAISAMNTNQLKLLALAMNIKYVVPLRIPEEINNQDQFDNYITQWITERVSNLIDTPYTRLDLDHLEALSCLTVMRIGSTDLNGVISSKFKEFKFQVNLEKFNSSAIHKKIIESWNKGLNSAILTTVGQLIGVYVSDMITESNTTLCAEWL